MIGFYNVPAPAKINWFLHVLGRRADGYHELQTVFQFVDCCDWMDFERRPDGVITRRGAPGLPADDLSVRAARLLQQRGGSAWGVDITLRKAIPAQAGLGGGSSDAATTLLALNRLWELDLSRAELLELALELGADVPVFVFGRNAFAQGVGERLQELVLPAWSLLLGWPGQGLATAAIFGAGALRRDTAALCAGDFTAHLQRAHDLAPGAGLARALGLDFGRNDLEAVARDCLPEIGRLAAWLGAHAGGGLARMSGSGSALFAPCRQGAGAALDADPRWWVRECRALEAHPLRDWAR
jgi:4-diphosphocytidyl-2-C-methyl-D-erythritol kinase